MEEQSRFLLFVFKLFVYFNLFLILCKFYFNKLFVYCTYSKAAENLPAVTKNLLNINF